MNFAKATGYRFDNFCVGSGWTKKDCAYVIGEFYNLILC